MEKTRKKEKMEADRETKEEVSKKRTTEAEKEENETVIVKRRCVDPYSTDAFDFFSSGEDLESCGNLWDDPCGLSDRDSWTWTGVLFVIDVLVSLSSAVTEVCDGFPLGSDWELEEPQSFLQKVFV